MRNTRFVSYFTILLILLQSFSAVANSLDFHATDPQHLVEVHQHSDDNNVDDVDDVDSLDREPFHRFMKKPNDANDANDFNNVSDAKNVTTSYHNPTDCHHYGHCNGTHIQWVVQHTLQSNHVAQQSHQFYYLRTAIDAPVNQLLRPPRA
jgi:hypothetical protein